MAPTLQESLSIESAFGTYKLLAKTFIRNSLNR